MANNLVSGAASKTSAGKTAANVRQQANAVTGKNTGSAISNFVSGYNQAVDQNASNPAPASTAAPDYYSAASTTPAANYYAQAQSDAEREQDKLNKQAAQNQTALSQQNIRDVKNQLARQLSNFDLADAQNRALADTQLNQNSRKMSADRFEAQRDLRDAALGLLGSMGQAMNGSSTGNLMRMLQSRNDKENNTFWAQHQVNQDAIENAYDDSLNQNNIARRDAMQSAEKAIRDISADWAASMANIDPDWFKLGNVGDIDVATSDQRKAAKSLSSDTAWTPTAAPQNNATISGYLIPDNRGNSSNSSSLVGNIINSISGGGRPSGNSTTVHNTPLYAQAMNTGAPRNRMAGTDYFSRLMNRFNGR